MSLDVRRDEATDRDRIFAAFRIELPEDEREAHWRSLLRHYRRLAASAPLDLRTAAFDYFINETQLLAEPLVVERRALEKAEMLAYSDPLTGLANVAAFDAELRLEVARARRHGRSLSLLLLDLDGFKEWNDRKGHLAGNEALCRLARILRDGLRAGDVVGRFGGDEFAVLLHEAALDAAVRIARGLGAAIERRLAPGEGEPGLGASIGVAAFPAQASTAVELFERADRALYHAKRKGGRRVAFFAADGRPRAMGPHGGGRRPFAAS